jgi:hypothetical protein
MAINGASLNTLTQHDNLFLMRENVIVNQGFKRLQQASG